MQTYSQLFPIHEPAQVEAMLAEDLMTGGFLLMQNNTPYDCNLLIWKETSPSGKPVQLAVRAGGSMQYGGELGYFQVFSAGANGSSVGVKPAGFGGGYMGAGAVMQANVIGYIQVVAWDEPVPINMTQANFNQVSATIDTELPAGSKHIGQVALDAEIPAGSQHVGQVALDAEIPAGSQHIGQVGIDYEVTEPIVLADAVASTADQSFANSQALTGCQSQMLYMRVDAATTLTVDVSPDGNDWYTFDVWSTSGATSTAIEIPKSPFVQVTTSDNCTLSAKISQTK